MIKPFSVYEQAIANTNYSAQLSEINHNVCQGNDLMKNYVKYVDIRLDDVIRKKKKSCLSHMIAIGNNGEILLVYVYDDNSTNAEVLFLNYFGKWKISRLVFEKTEQKKEYFVIFFETVKKAIFGEITKITPDRLNSYFIRAGVRFNSKIAENIRKKALFETFGPQIKECISEYKIPELAGWYNHNFMHAANCPFRNEVDLPKLPIMKKIFSIVDDFERAKKYIESIIGIRQYKNRIAVLIVPLMGILSSLLLEEKVNRVNFNFVCLNTQNSRFLVRLFQIFNRSLTEVINLEISDKEIKNKLLQINDEVVVIDMINDNGTAYQKKKKENNAYKIIEKMSMYETTDFNIRRQINAVLVILNHTVIEFQTVLNLFVDDEFYCDKFKIEDALKEQYLEAFFTVFIMFIQQNMQETKRKIRNLKRQYAVDTKVEAIAMTWELLEWFCSAEGIDLKMTLQLPNKINFIEIFAEEFEGLEEAFVKIVRGEIKHWKVIQKNKKVNADIVSASCFYDDEYLYIPTKIFDRMIGKNGYLPKKFEILSMLKDKGGLKTNAEGLSCRLQVDGQRFETYKFKIQIFNKLGFPDIIDLGKETE